MVLGSRGRSQPPEARAEARGGGAEGLAREGLARKGLAGQGRRARGDVRAGCEQGDYLAWLCVCSRLFSVGRIYRDVFSGF